MLDKRDRRRAIERLIAECDALLDANVDELAYDWNGYVGEARGRLDAALESLEADGTPTDVRQPVTRQP